MIAAEEDAARAFLRNAIDPRDRVLESLVAVVAERQEFRQGVKRDRLQVDEGPADFLQRDLSAGNHPGESETADGGAK